MSLTPEQVSRVAQLARISLSAEASERIRGELNDIFVLIEEMQAVDTTGVEPMSHAGDLTQRLRPDVVTETDQREAFQAIAPETEAGLYLVPRVIE